MFTLLLLAGAPLLPMVGAAKFMLLDERNIVSTNATLVLGAGELKHPAGAMKFDDDGLATSTRTSFGAWASGGSAAAAPAGPRPAGSGPANRRACMGTDVLILATFWAPLGIIYCTR